MKKGVDWALRAVGGRNRALNAAAVALCRRLASSPDAAAQKMGKAMLKELTGAAIARRLAARAQR